MYETTRQLINQKTTKKELLAHLTAKFNIAPKEVHKRIKSMFGMSIDDLLTPSKEEMTRAILQAESIPELKGLLKKDNGLATLYDKYYGVSTFADG